MRTLAALVLTSSILQLPVVCQDLKIHFIDTEGGQATLIVTPAGESLLVDAGWPGNEGRDAKRIIATAEKAGVKRIDYLVMTHYHLDHVGGIPELADRFPVGTMVDHGTNTETNGTAKRLEATYMSYFDKGVKRLTVKPGDRIPLKGVDVEVVTARGEHVAKPIKGGGQKNQYCGQDEPKSADSSENARSIGMVFTFGKFRFVDLGDLTWNKEIDLVCPQNAIGPIDLYLTTHHGLDQSNPKAIVYGLKPRVAIMNNGAKKGGSVPTWQTVSTSPGLQDMWQLHYALAGGEANNVPEQRIANVDEKCEGHGIIVTAKKNGDFTVTNERNGFKKTYTK